MASGRAAVILTRIYGYACLVLLCASLTLFGLWQYEVGRKHKALAAFGAAQVKAQIAAREAEHRHAVALAEIAEQYEQDKRAADEAQRKLVADLRAGTVRLQNRWRGCEATSAATAGELDAAARDREASAGRIVRAARDADDWIKRLQEIVKQDRK